MNTQLTSDILSPDLQGPGYVGAMLNELSEMTAGVGNRTQNSGSQVLES